MIAKTSIMENPGMALVVIGLVAILGYTFKTAFWASNEAVHRDLTCGEQFRGKAVDECAEQLTEVQKRCDEKFDFGGRSDPEARKEVQKHPGFGMACKQAVIARHSGRCGAELRNEFLPV